MKSFLMPWFFVTICSFSIWAQTADTLSAGIVKPLVIAYKTDQWKNNDWANQDSTSLTYSGNHGGEFFSASQFYPPYHTKQTFRWKNGSWQNNMFYQREYDQQNLMLRTHTKNWKDGAWENHRLYIYGFNSGGVKTTEIILAWNSGIWDSVFHTELIYDTAGNLLSDEGWSWNNGVVRHTKACHTYTSTNKILTTKACLAENANEYLWEYKYDEHGNQVAKISESGIGHKFNRKKRELYTYSEDNKLLEAIHQWYKDSTWQTSITVTHSYNAAGERVKTTTIYDKEYEQLRSSIDTYKWDKDNGIQTMEVMERVNGEWKLARNWIQKFDKDGNRIQNIFGSWVDGKYVESEASVSIYNEFNQLLTEERRNHGYDGDTTISRYTKFYEMP